MPLHAPASPDGLFAKACGREARQLWTPEDEQLIFGAAQCLSPPLVVAQTQSS
ncbi:hypothetical protein M3J09_003103 [Ascochyta lentis]